MLVPPTATFDDFGLGVDLALGRWDITRPRSFRTGWHGRHERRGAGPGDLPPDRLMHVAVAKGTQFEYLFDDDEKWIHECVVEELVGRRLTDGRPPIPVPLLGWGSVPDQFGRTSPEEVGLLGPEGSATDPATHPAADAATDPATDAANDSATGPETGSAATPEGESAPPRGRPTRAGKGSAPATGTPGATGGIARAPEPGSAGGPAAEGQRRHRGAAKPLDLAAVRSGSRSTDVGALLSSIEGRDLGPALQQVGDALLRTYRSAGLVDQRRLVRPLREIERLLGDRVWEGDDVLAEEIDALLSGSERRGRTLNVDIEELSEVMANGGADPGGYLHLDTGEVVHAFLHHSMEDLDTPGLPENEEAGREVDNLWIYVDHDTEAAYADMEAFAQAVSDRVAGILTVAIRGKGAFARFRRTVDELDLWGEWQVFSDDRAFGRARALLRSQGIRPV